MGRALFRTGTLLLWVVSVFGQASFEKATVTPSEATPSQQMWHIQSWRVDIRGATLADLIASAYRWKAEAIVLPEWTKTARYDISAMLPDDVPKERFPELLRTLLADRFALKVHQETRTRPAWALVIAEGGLKLKPAAPGARAGTSSTQQGTLVIGTLGNIGTLAAGATGGRPILDRTGSDALYEGVVEPTVMLAQMNGRFTEALREEAVRKLGLKLIDAESSAETLVVDSVDRVQRPN